MWRAASLKIAAVGALLIGARVARLEARDDYGESVRKLRGQIVETVGTVEAVRIPVPFELDRATIEHVRLLVRGENTNEGKCRRLVDFMMGRNELNVTYQAIASGTAADVLADRIGNCLARTSLFVGMARVAGMRAVYVHVTEVNRFAESLDGRSTARLDDGLVVHTSHICAGIDQGGPLFLVDFVPGRPTHPYRTYRRLDDMEALAHLFNNRGFEAGLRAAGDMKSDSAEEELRCYELAIRLIPDFYPAYNNLGNAWRRRGDQAMAQQMFEKAIAMKPDFADARLNLASLYYLQGRLFEAAAQLEMAIRSDSSNPYLYQNLGEVYRRQGWDAAAAALYRKALSKGRSASFFVGLARSQLALEQQLEATATLKEGLKYYPDDRHLKWLLSVAAGG